MVIRDRIRRWMLFVLVILLCVVFGVHWQIKQTESELRDKLLRDTRIIASSIAVERVEALSDGEVDLNSSDYLRLKEQLGDICSSDTKFRFIYLLGRKADGRVFFLVDNEPVGSPDEAPGGMIYGDVPDGFVSVFETGDAGVEGPFTDQWGSFVSACIPFSNTHEGVVSTVLAVDVDASHWRRTVLLNAAIPAAMGAGMMVLLGLSVMLLQSRHRILRQQNSLQDSENRFFLLYESIADIVFVIGEDGIILHANKAALENLGYKADELKGMHVRNLHPEGCRSELEALFAAVLRGERSDCPLPLVGRDGSLLPVETNCRRSKWGECDCLIAMVRVLSPADEAQQVLDSTFQHSPIPMAFSVLSSRNFSDVNDAFLQFTGYRREEVIGRSSADLGLFVDQNEQRAVAERLEAEGKITNCEIRVRCRNGEIRYGLFSGELIVSQGRQYLLTAAIDITARKQAQEDLRRERDLFASGPVFTIAWAFAEDWPVLEVSTNVEEILGYSPDEMKAADFRYASILHPEDRKRCDPEVEYNIENRIDSYEQSYRLKTKSGEYRWFHDFTRLIRDEQGELVAIRGYLYDQTTQKKAEKNLIRLQAAIEQIDEMVVITDTNAEIQYVNPVFTTLTGYPRDEIIGQNPRLLKSGEQDDSFYRELWATISNGKTWTGRMVNKRKDGSFFTEDAVISPVFDEDGVLVNYVAVKRDISEELLLAEQLSQAQKMESVGRLAGGVAHDFNNMLSVILGYGEMIMNKLAADDPLRKRVHHIVTAAQRSADLTRQLLAFARKQFAEPKLMDMNDAVSAILKMLGRLIGEEIELAWEPAEEPCPVMMDPSQIDQIMANLMVNASDAIDGVGRIKVTTTCTEISMNAAEKNSVTPGKYIILGVMDNGCGMDEETRRNIFEPFFTTKKTGEGTGLGLATVYGIIKQNGGFIDVYSTPGEGTEFRIYLPRCEQEESSRDYLSESAIIPRGNGETLLVVDDEPSVLNITGDILEDLGYKVLRASGPGEAQALADSSDEKIDLLLSDLVMPEMNGRELYSLLAQSRPELKVLFMSGYASETITQKSLNCADMNFMKKPFSTVDIASRVRRVLKSVSR